MEGLFKANIYFLQAGDANVQMGTWISCSSICFGIVAWYSQKSIWKFFKDKTKIIGPLRLCQPQ